MILKWFIQQLSNLNLRTYIFFLVISSSIWIVMKLSDQHTKEIEVKLEYLVEPKGFMNVELPSSKLKVMATAEGFKILGISRKNKSGIKINMADLKIKKAKDNLYHAFIVSKSLLPKIEEQLGISISEENMKPDTLFFSFDLITHKKVAIEANTDIEMQQGYKLYGMPHLSLDSVKITGPKSMVDTIESIKTEPISAQDVHKSFDKEAQLVVPNKFIKLESQKINLHFEVVEFIEAKYLVPIKLKTDIPDISVQTFPAKVEVRYQVPLPLFSNIQDTSFTVIVELDSFKAFSHKKLIPKIIKHPDFIINPVLENKEVDFIILKDKVSK